MLTALGEHGRDLVPGFLEQAHQLERLVRRNSAADDQQHACHGAALPPPDGGVEAWRLTAAPAAANFAGEVRRGGMRFLTGLMLTAIAAGPVSAAAQSQDSTARSGRSNGSAAARPEWCSVTRAQTASRASPVR